MFSTGPYEEPSMRFVPRLSLSLLRSAVLLLLLAILPFAAGGCAAALANVAKAGGQTVIPSYKGLHDQKVGIMVWAPEGITIDHPEIQADVAKGLQKKLSEAGTAEVKNITWMKADDILRFQEDHPELSVQPATDLAARLPVTRLIYIEISSVSLHPNDAVDLSRGEAIVDMRTIEVTNGIAKDGYPPENNISVVYPPHAPPEGVTGLEDAELYRSTIDALTSELAKHFISYDADDQ
jgi:hypothetical protein